MTAFCFGFDGLKLSECPTGRLGAGKSVSSTGMANSLAENCKPMPPMAMKINLRNMTGAIGIMFTVCIEAAHVLKRDAPRFTDDVNEIATELT